MKYETKAYTTTDYVITSTMGNVWTIIAHCPDEGSCNLILSALAGQDALAARVQELEKYEEIATDKIDMLNRDKTRLVSRVGELEAENKRLREACKVALDRAYHEPHCPQGGDYEAACIC